MKKNSRIFVAGHRGLVGSAIWKSLENKGYSYLIGRTHKELDLEDPAAVREFFDREKPEYVFLAAAFVGGIIANSRYRADFIFRNLQIQQNVRPPKMINVHVVRFSRTSSGKASGMAYPSSSSWGAPASTRAKLPSP